jgi:hypothetical protein
MMNGADPTSLQFPPGVVAQLNAFRVFDFGNHDAYLYAKANPVYWLDPLGLKPCRSDPTLAGCQGPGTGCCIASCIDDLRVSLCSWRRVEPWISAAGGLLVGIGGAAVGLEFGGPIGACIGGGAGIVIGATGGYLGFDQLIPIEAFHQSFKNCIHNHCGVQCKPGGPCFIDDLFSMTIRE